MRLILVAICLYMIWGYSAQADAATAPTVSQVNTTITKAESVVKKKEDKFSLQLDFSHTSNLRNQADAEYKADSTLIIAPSLRISSKAKLNARLDIVQNHYANELAELSNLLVSVARDPIKISANNDLKMTVTSYLPTNEADRNDNSFMGAAGASVGVVHKYMILKKSGSIEGTLSALKNFHEFERTNMNEANLSHRVRYVTTVSQDLIGDLSVQVIGRYQTGWTYQNALRTAFLLDEKLVLQVSKNTSFYVNHTNDGDALQPNGLDSNIRIYDERSSVWGTGLSVDF